MGLYVCLSEAPRGVDTLARYIDVHRYELRKTKDLRRLSFLFLLMRKGSTTAFAS